MQNPSLPSFPAPANAASPTVRLICLAFLVCLSSACGGPSPAPDPPLPPSASDLDILGPLRLCQVQETTKRTWNARATQSSTHGTWTEWSGKISNPQLHTQWLIFNEDDILIASIASFPGGLPLEPYPTLRRTLSRLEPARRFFTDASLLLEGQQPETIVLYRTGDKTTTTQYFTRGDGETPEALLVAVTVLDPYEALLDGAQPQFLEPALRARGVTLPTTAATISTTEMEEASAAFRASQQFARGEIALFQSCGSQTPDTAIDAYQRAIEIGLDNTAQLAEAYHRLGLALKHKHRYREAQAALEQSLTIRPHAARVLNSLGTVFAQLKRPNRAIEHFEQAIALQPNYARARYNLAKAYEPIDPQRAIDEYETYLALTATRPGERAHAIQAESRIESLQQHR